MEKDDNIFFEKLVNREVRDQTQTMYCAFIQS